MLRVEQRRRFDERRVGDFAKHFRSDLSTGIAVDAGRIDDNVSRDVAGDSQLWIRHDVFIPAGWFVCDQACDSSNDQAVRDAASELFTTAIRRTGDRQNEFEICRCREREIGNGGDRKGKHITHKLTGQ